MPSWRCWSLTWVRLHHLLVKVVDSSTPHEACRIHKYSRLNPSPHKTLQIQKQFSKLLCPMQYQLLHISKYNICFIMKDMEMMQLIQQQSFTHWKWCSWFNCILYCQFKWCSGIHCIVENSSKDAVESAASFLMGKTLQLNQLHHFHIFSSLPFNISRKQASPPPPPGGVPQDKRQDAPWSRPIRLAEAISGRHTMPRWAPRVVSSSK